MIIKKSTKCNQCKSYIDFYIDEFPHFNNIALKCKCGCSQTYVTDASNKKEKARKNPTRY